MELNCVSASYYQNVNSDASPGSVITIPAPGVEIQLGNRSWLEFLIVLLSLPLRSVQELKNDRFFPHLCKSLPFCASYVQML
jgi:hypothetical protein